LTWHYRNADPEFGSWQATELQVNLEKLLSHMALSVRVWGWGKGDILMLYYRLFWATRLWNYGLLL
jgi:hypothetical protein